MRLVLSPTQHEHDREVTLLERLMHGTTDGALIVLPEESSDELERLLDQGYRFVVVDPLPPLDERIPAVSAAHTAGADQAMQHLLALGHRRIGAITGPRGWVATEDRRRGYHAALAAAGIAARPGARGRVGLRDRRRRRGRGSALLDLAEPPTAIFAFNDNLAIGAIQAARARGLRVPEDLSVVGFDDVEHATIVTPALTTVRQPLAEMGRIAVSLLLRLLEKQRIETLPSSSRHARRPRVDGPPSHRLTTTQQRTERAATRSSGASACKVLDPDQPRYLRTSSRRAGRGKRPAVARGARRRHRPSDRPAVYQKPPSLKPIGLRTQPK